MIDSGIILASSQGTPNIRMRGTPQGQADGGTLAPDNAPRRQEAQIADTLRGGTPWAVGHVGPLYPSWSRLRVEYGRIR